MAHSHAPAIRKGAIMRVYAYVLARSGSKGLPNKNILEIMGHPLFAYSIAFAKKVGLDRIIVSTDSPQYREIALAYGGECPYLRGAKASTDTALDEEILADLDANLPRCGIELPDIWVRLKPTCPLRSVASVQAAVAALKSDPSLDSVRVTSVADARLQIVNADGFLEPLLPVWNPARSIVLRSDFPRAYKAFNLDVFYHEGWRRRGALFMGHRIKPIVEHKITGLDIDDADDFELVKALISLRPRPQFLQPYIHDPQR
jgi:CMP-N-acetylneuraminic acid synthetase